MENLTIMMKHTKITDLNSIVKTDRFQKSFQNLKNARSEINSECTKVYKEYVDGDDLFALHLAGGSLRDLFFGYKPSDIDIFITCNNPEIMSYRYKLCLSYVIKTTKLTPSTSDSKFGAVQSVINKPDSNIQLIICQNKYTEEFSDFSNNKTFPERSSETKFKPEKFNFGINRIWYNHNEDKLEWTEEFEKDLVDGTSTLYLDDEHDSGFSMAKSLSKWNKWKENNRNYGKLKFCKKLLEKPEMFKFPDNFKEHTIYHEMYMS